MIFCCLSYRYGSHRDLHKLTHSSPTRRSTELAIQKWRHYTVQGRLRTLYHRAATHVRHSSVQRAKPAGGGHRLMSKEKMQRLSVMDDAFLRIESRRQPLHIGMLMLFEPPPDGGEDRKSTRLNSSH